MARRAQQVRIESDLIAPYAASLPLERQPEEPPPEEQLLPHQLPPDREVVSAFWLTLNAINFGSGWFPTLRKRGNRSGYHTIAAGLNGRIRSRGPWSAPELAGMTTPELASVLGQDPQHPLMGLFTGSLRDLGRHLIEAYDGSFSAVATASGGSAVGLARQLGGWECFADDSRYETITVPFLKRAQLAAADLARAGVIDAPDLGQLTMFADNLVPHVLRLDGILTFDPRLVARIEREELIDHGSPEEVEIRACAVHAVELIVTARPGRLPSEVDQLLWRRGQGRQYKSVPRHRSRCTAY